MSRAKRSIFNFSTLLIFNLLLILTGFVTTPVILNFLGSEAFGAFRAMSDWFGYLALIGFGLNGALLTAFTRAFSNTPKFAPGETFAAGVQAYTRIMCWTLLAAIGLSLFMHHIVPVNPTLAKNLDYAAWITCFGFLLIPLSPIQFYLEARQRGHLVNLTMSLQRLILAGLSVYLAWIGWGIAGQALASVLSTALFFLFLSLTVRKDPSLIKPKKISPDLAGDLKNNSKTFFLIEISGRLSMFSDNILVAFIAGPSLVTQFFVTQRLMQVLQGQLMGFGNSSWAGLAELYQSGQREVFATKVLEISNAVASFSLIGLIPIAVLNSEFIALWLGPGYFGGELLTLTVCLNVFFISLISFWGWIFLSSGQLDRFSKLSVFCGVINFVLSVAGTFAFGIIGPALGSLIGYGVIKFALMIKLIHIELNMNSRILLAAVFRPVAFLLPFYFVFRYLALRVPPNHWWSLALYFFAFETILILVWWLKVLPRQGRLIWKNRLRHLWVRN